MESPAAPGRGRLYRKLAADVAALGLPASSPALAVVTEADLGALPDAAVIRMWNRRATVGQLLYCHASQRIHGSRGRSRNRPAKCATNEESGGRPATLMKFRYRTAASGRAPRSASVTTASAGELAGKPSAATSAASFR